MNIIFEMLNKAGLRFIEFASPMLIQSSILILILLAADFLLRKKVRAIFRYWIWMIVLVKLILPASLYSPLSLGSWFGEKIEYSNLTQEDTGQGTHKSENIIDFKSEIQDFRPIEPRVESSESLPSVPHTIVTNPQTASSEQVVTEKTVKLSWQAAVFVIWIAVTAALGLVLIKRTVFIKELVTKASDIDFSQNNSISPNDILKHCCISIDLKKQIPLKISPDATSPVVCGLLRPAILLPQNLISSLSPGQLKAIFFHELAHIKRGDLWVNLLQTLLQITYFYNPLLWLANSIIRRTREQAVDEMVLVAMGKEADQYPETLLNVAKLAFKRPALSLRLIGVVESENALTGRIKHMLSRPLPKSAKLGLLGLLTIIIFAAILLPMAKKENSFRLKKIEFSVNRNDKENTDIKTQYAGASELMKAFVEALLNNNEIAIADITSNANENTKQFRLSFNEIDKIKQLDIKSYSPSCWRTLTIKQSNIKAKISLLGTGTIKLIDGVRYSLLAIITQINDGPWQLKDARWYRIGSDIEESGKLLSKELTESAVELAGIVEPDEIISAKDKEDLEKEYVRLNKATFKFLKNKESSDSGSTLYGYKISPSKESVVIYSFPFFEALRKGDLDSKDITTPNDLRSKLERISELCNLENIEIEDIYSSQSFAIVITKGVQRNDNLPYQLGFTFLCPFGQWIFNDIDWIDTENRQDFIDGFKYNFPNVTRVFSSDYSTIKDTTSNGSMGGLESWGEEVNGVKARLVSYGNYIISGHIPNIKLEAKNESGQRIEVIYPPKFTKRSGEKEGDWNGFGEIEIYNDKGDRFEAEWNSGSPYILPVNDGSSLRADCQFEMYGFSLPGSGKYKARVTFGVQPQEGKTFKVTTGWLEFNALLTDHIPGTPYTAKEAFEEAKAYDNVLLQQNNISREEVVEKFLSVAENYPDTPYEIKAYHWAAVILSQRLILPDDHPTEEHRERAKQIWKKIITKWPDLVSTETISVRYNLASTDKNQFEKLVDFYSWLISIPEDKKIKFIDDTLITLEPNLTRYRNTEQLKIIIDSFPETHLAELAKIELKNIKILLSRTEESKNISDDSQTQQNPKSFTKLLPNGGTLELVGVRKKSLPDQPWYSPDGLQKLDSSDEIFSHITGTSGIVNAAGTQTYEFFIHCDLPSNTRDKVVKNKWSFEPEKGIPGSFFTSFSSGQHYFTANSAFPETLNKLNLTFNVSNGQWKTISESDGLNKKEISITHRGQKQNITLGEIIEKDGGVFIEVKHQVKEMAAQIIVFEKNNNVRYPLDNVLDYADPNGNILITKCKFDGMTKEQISRYEFQVQPIDIVTFKNISLKNEFHTNPEITTTSITEKTPIENVATEGTENTEHNSLSISYEYAGLENIKVSDGSLDYVWHTLKKDLIVVPQNMSSYDKHEFKKKLSEDEIKLFEKWIKDCNVFNLPTKFPRGDGTSYASAFVSSFEVKYSEKSYRGGWSEDDTVPGEINKTVQNLRDITNEIKDKSEISWGQEIEKIQIRVRMDQQFHEGQIPKFLMDVRNNGTEDLRLVLAPEWWELELDGLWYKVGTWYSGIVPVMSLDSGEQKNGIEFVPDENWDWNNNSNPLKFLKGTHEARLLHTVFPKDPNDKRSTRVLSNRIEFEIFPKEVKSGSKQNISVTEIKPLPIDKIDEMFGRIRNDEEIDLLLIYQSLIGPQTTLRADAARYLGTHGDSNSIPHLIDALSDDSSHVGDHYSDMGMHTTRYWANDSLKKLTGLDVGFVWNDPIEKRNKAIRKWKYWWEKNESTFKVINNNDREEIENIVGSLWQAVDANDTKKVSQLYYDKIIDNNDSNTNGLIHGLLKDKEQVEKLKGNDIASISNIVIKNSRAIAVTKPSMELFIYYFVKPDDKWFLYYTQRITNFSKIIDLEPSIAINDLFNDWPRTKLDNEAGSAYFEAGKLLHEGTDREEVAKKFLFIGELYPLTDRGKICTELGTMLNEMVQEDKEFVEPSDINSLTTQQKIDYYIYKLRDVAEQEFTVPGKCFVLRYPRTPDSAAVALRNMGPIVIPAMISLLEDNRPTRSVGAAMNGGVVLRYCDIALEIIADIAGQNKPNETTTFDPRTQRGAYLSSADEKIAREIIDRAKSWWEQNKDKYDLSSDIR